MANKPLVALLAAVMLLTAGAAVQAAPADPAPAPIAAPAAQPAVQPAPLAPPTLAEAVAPASIPALHAHVTDQIGMLAPAQRNALESVLTDYERRTGSQIAILLVASTAPDPIENFGIRVADAWKVGRKGIDDGVLLIVARDNPKDLRRLRIEAGRGVQGTLTDAQSKRILQDTIAPHFRNNDYYGGLAAGVAAITSLLDKEHFAPPSKTEAALDTAGQSWPFLLVAVIIMAILLRSRGSGGRLQHGPGGWDDASGVALGAILSQALNTRRHGGGFDGFGGGGGGGGFGGGGGGFDGGGASGDW